MSSGILLGPDARPITKSEVEARTERLHKYLTPIVGGLFGQPHPLLSDEEGGYTGRERGMLEPFVFAEPSSDEHADYATSITNTPGTYNDRFVKRNPISDLDTPKDIYGVLNLSMRYAEEHYIVNRAIKVKKNFALRDMRIVHRNDSTVKHFTDEFKRLKMRQILSQVFRYHEITGRVVVYWGYEHPIEGLCLLDPRYVVVRRFLNKTYVTLKPHPTWVSASKNPTSKEYKFLQKNLPTQWMKYIKANEEIPLDDDTYALIENDLSLFETRGISDRTIGGVPLSACFDALKISKMLMAGDFSAAWMMKNMIALVSIGDPDQDDYTPPDQTELRKLQAAFQRPEYAMWAYVDPTVNIRYFTPDPGVFDSKKYLHSTQQIEHVLGIPGVFTNDDPSYAAGALSLKPFREEILNMRLNIADQLFSKLLPIMREGYSAKRTGGANIPDVMFDENCLKDDTVLFNELTGYHDRGALSLRSLLEGRSYDFDTELARKKEEKKDADDLMPIYDIAHGPVSVMLEGAGGDGKTNGGEGGRPSTTGKPTAEGGTGGAASRPSRPR